MGWSIESDRHILCIPMDSLDDKTAKHIRQNYSNFIEQGWASTDGDERGILINCLPRGFQVSLKKDFEELIRHLRTGGKIYRWSGSYNLGYFFISRMGWDVELHENYPDLYQYFTEEGDLKDDYVFS